METLLTLRFGHELTGNDVLCIKQRLDDFYKQSSIGPMVVLEDPPPKPKPVRPVGKPGHRLTEAEQRERLMFYQNQWLARQTRRRM